jgi:hypothetical protein
MWNMEHFLFFKKILGELVYLGGLGGHSKTQSPW